jgi:ketosteroid isomerase-like protein
MKPLWCVCALVLAISASPAHADLDDPTADAKGLLDKLVRAINARDAKALAATFHDGYAIFPTAADEGTGAGIEPAAKHWLGTLGDATYKISGAHYGDGWFDAELVPATGSRLRITGAIHSWFDDAKEQKLHRELGGLHISEAVDDKVAIAAAAAGKLPALGKLGSGEIDATLDLRPEGIAAYAKHVSDDPGATVVGSAPGERAVGKAAIAKLLGRWKSLKLVTTSVVTGHDDNNMLLGWAVAHAEASFKTGGKTVKVPYRMLIVIMEPWAVAAEHGDTSKLCVVHFSVATK